MMYAATEIIRLYVILCLMAPNYAPQATSFWLDSAMMQEWEELAAMAYL
jgi:hypothetical protein